MNVIIENVGITTGGYIDITGKIGKTVNINGVQTSAPDARIDIRDDGPTEQGQPE